MNQDSEPPGADPLDITGLDPVSLMGPADANLRAIARNYKTRVVVRSGRVRLSGPKEEEVEVTTLLRRLIGRCRKGEAVNPELVQAEIDRLRGVKTGADGDCDGPRRLQVKTPRKVIIAKTPNQQGYLNAIARSDVVLAIGPAGTGKTYLAVAAAVEALVCGRCHRIILTRPAVEAGESLGYLPGTFKDKVDPYLRPLYDALFDMMPLERARRMIEEEVIEVAPLAFMRGRTLSDAYIILDEAQNTTSTQMKMFLTRLGWNSKAIVTGDVTQIDLEQTDKSGLIDAERRLHSVRGIALARFTEKDVVRPPLVSRIITAYDGHRPRSVDMGTEPPAGANGETDDN